MVFGSEDKTAKVHIAVKDKGYEWTDKEHRLEDRSYVNESRNVGRVEVDCSTVRASSVKSATNKQHRKRESWDDSSQSLLQWRKTQKIADDARQVYLEHLLDPANPEGSAKKVAPGLQNPGNLCYMNVVVQLLYGMKCTRGLFWGGSFWKGRQDLISHCKFAQFGREGGFIAVALHKLFQKMHLKDCQHSVELFKDVLVSNASFVDFDNKRQHDASELLTKLLDALSTALNVDGGGDPISKWFRSQAMSWVQCQTCTTKSINGQDNSITLEVPVTGESIQTCLWNYFKSEEIHGWTCGYCNKARPAWKGFLLEPRNILIISLKRYGLPGTKNGSLVHFPLKDLDILRFMVPEMNVPTKYALVAVVNHYGDSLVCGHYDLIMRTGDTMWHRFDDEDVAPMDANDLVTENAYIIVYCRQDKFTELIL